MLDVGALSGPLATPNDIAVGGPDLLRVIIGRDDHAGDAALERGEAVVFTPALVHRGTAAVSVAGSNGGPVAVPATALPVGSRSAAAGAILPASLASRLRLTPVTEQYLVSTPSTPTQSDVDRAQAALARPGDAGIYADLTVERGYQPQRWGYGLLALALVAAIVTLGATGITTGLSAAESRPDLATLAAVGGSPLTRRLLVAHQAGTVALLGSLTGVVSGLVPAYGVLRSRADYPFTVPWETIGVVAVGVPLLAVVATALLTSTRGTISRRAA
jgi:putative ABC transport system permease protein